MVWEAELTLGVDGTATGRLISDVDEFLRRRMRRLQVAAGALVARAAFDVHLADNRVVLLKESCGEGDVAPRFFLHAFPVDADSLPLARRRFGFEGRDFEFVTYGVRIDGRCAVERVLPAYPLERVRVGQFNAADELWQVEFAPAATGG